MNLPTVPIEISDPVNARILAVSEDKIQGFQRDPFGEIARLSGVELPVVIERIQAMLRAGTIRRVRQTLMATNLAPGALVAWQMPADRLDAAFDFMFQQRPVFRPRRSSAPPIPPRPARITGSGPRSRCRRVFRCGNIANFFCARPARNISGSCPPNACLPWASATSAAAA